ncbi:aminotransferase class V-fold PLP-dependent enzyme [Curvivirga aplysinae]|uniref:aminotransferase class V-fold PLP-dependent enzyme n=1 Tax=Curvivirga aplysinae TaxID=2529852 RepID=UPI0012BC49A0|nr:aminotransferase class V-fold PLP-dependent enzyme [Curvivirga aplysinae]MTI10262.1 aminotransferase class V-fold PLP-dependent enzyme [Curvivirga aplysinae]
MSATPALRDQNEPITETGHAVRDYWLLEPDISYLNHGAFGALAKDVHDVANNWRILMERQPSEFIREILRPNLRKTADFLGNYVGAQGEDIVFVDNASTAINAVLRSLVLLPGDEVVTTNHAHETVLRTLEFICERAGARLHIATIPFPIEEPDDAVDAITDRLSPRTRLVVIDHITSLTGLALPLQNILDECSERAIPTLVDGAHAPGQVNLNIEKMGCGWYVGNAHKWLGAPRGSAFLWTQQDLQARVRPTTISNFISDGYTAAFDWPGTKDFSSYLSIIAAIEFRARFGEEKIAEYCQDLIIKAADYLSTVLDVERGAPNNMTGFMTSFAWPGKDKATLENVNNIRLILRNEYQVEVEPKIINGKIWIRICAYIYNEMDDYKKLARAVQDIVSKDLISQA